MNNGYFTKKDKLDEFFYRLEYEDIDYNFACKYYKENSISIGGCTSFRLGKYFGRNYDWVYDNTASFLVSTPRTKTSHRVIGMAGGLTELTGSFVDSGQDSLLYKIVPFALLDGMNDAGLVVSMNVVPVDYGNNEAIPNCYSKITLCNLMIPRFLLDKFSRAVDAILFLQNYCKIYNAAKLKKLGYEIHFIISDKQGNTFILEIINNKLTILKGNIMTNFHLTNVHFNKDGKVFTPATQMNNINATTYNGITKYGCGLERFNLVKSLKKYTKEDIRMILKELYYSNAYKNLNWFTEFTGNDLYVNSSVREYIKHIAPIMDELEYKSRENSKLWQTVHSSLYDLNEGSIEVTVQENSEKIFKERL